MKKILAVIAVVLVIFGTWIASSYNSLIQLDEDANKEFSNVETDLQRRFDLVPNLVATVKGAANFEQETFTEVTEARSAWANAQSSGSQSDKIAAANSMEGALSRLLVTVEAYPELKATQAFMDLTAQLEGTENRISVSRKRYNEAATDYNKQRRRFPTNIIAGFFDFEEHALFEAVEGSEKAPTVEF